METMHAAGRRSLPPVPRVSSKKTATRPAAARRAATADAEQTRTEQTSTEQTSTEQTRTEQTGVERDDAQQFVEWLRAAAPDFAEAAGAVSAVVREAVPPARHRRSRCHLVLRFADGTESDVTLLGPTGTPGTPSRHGFDRQIRRWLGAGQRRDGAWLVPDPEASGGMAVDVSAWIAAS